MQRQRCTIEELNQAIARCWRPVYAEMDGNRIKVDLICEWRVPDGKVMLVEVPFATREEVTAINNALRSSLIGTAAALSENFSKAFSNAIYSLKAEGDRGS